MTAGKTAIYGVGGALLVAYLAAANMPSGDRPAPPERTPSQSSGPDTIASEVGSQAARLQSRMSQAPVPEQNPRNPFSFGAVPRPRPAQIVRAAVADEPAPAVAPIPSPPMLTLMGIAEETTAQGLRRTAVIGGDADTLYMVTEGQPVGDRYKVTKISADAVELEDIFTKAYRRLALR